MPGWQLACSLRHGYARKADSQIRARRQEAPTECLRFAQRDHAKFESSLAMLSRMKDVGGAALVTRTNLRGSNLSGREDRGRRQGYGNFHALVRGGKGGVD